MAAWTEAVGGADGPHVRQPSAKAMLWKSVATVPSGTGEGYDESENAATVG